MAAEELAFFRSGKDYIVLAKAGSLPSRPMPQWTHAKSIRPSSSSRGTSISPRVPRRQKRRDRLSGRTLRRLRLSGRSAVFCDPDGDMLEIIDLAATGVPPEEKAAVAAR